MSLLLYFNTIKYLKIEQIFFQVIYRIIKPGQIKNTKHSIKKRKYKNNFIYIARKSKTLISSNQFVFFGDKGSLLKDGWDAREKSKLWQYNLHYFDDLNAEDSEKRKDWHKGIIKNWVENYSLNFNGVGWEPYPVSLRSVNLIKWSLLGNELNQDELSCLFHHGLFLEKRLERHILGNHFFSRKRSTTSEISMAYLIKNNEK